MNIWQSVRGMMKIRINTADPAGLLKKVNRKNIPLYSIEAEGELQTTAVIYRKDWPEILPILQRYGAEAKVIDYLGVYWKSIAFVRRPVLLIGILIITILSLYLPGRIFFVEVQGNEQLQQELILEKAKSCGISFGSLRREVRSEKVKNQLLSELPELQWVGVNTSGCVAIIRVQEKTADQNMELTKHEVGHIVALRDGIIVSQTVLQGTALCGVGQAVKAGQILVSGYIDCGMKIQAGKANAEVLAQTSHTIDTILIADRRERSVIRSEKKNYSLLIGKKLINLYKDSGISDTTCVKIYKQEYLTLPGGFQLPVALITEQYLFYDVIPVQGETVEDYSWVVQYVDRYLCSQMIAGKILSSDTLFYQENERMYLQKNYLCLEMIGHVKLEETIYEDGKNSGENR